ncbi:MAG: tetratricopeptide repeat protein [Candidatus Omnitrophica bacterium]|nr:tetratricopeptide repeat protein [Candidatus Omnitrophota bacterium]
MLKNNIWSYVILTALCIAVYANSINGSFVSDDIPTIRENPLLGGPLYYFIFTPHTLINSLIYRLFGTNHIPYHVASIVLHIINTVLVFIFLKIFFNPLESLLSASVFAVHPAHAEAVAWISARPYEFLALFCLLCILLYYRATLPILNNKKIKLSNYLVAVTLFLYYLIFNYHFFFTLPLIIILLDVSFNRWQKAYRLWFPFIVAVIIRFAFVGEEVTRRIGYVIAEGGPHTISNDPLKYFLHSLTYHLKLLVWPAKLTLYHDPPYRSFASPLINVILCIALVLLLWLTFKRWRHLFFGIGLFIIALMPTYSPIPLSNPVSERYVYFASLGLSIGLAWMLERCSARSHYTKKIALTLVIILNIVFGIRTIARNNDWRSQENFWVTTARLAPNNPRALNNAGAAYLVAEKLNQAEEILLKAIRIAPYYADAYNNLGVTYRRLGKIQEGIKALNRAISLNPRSADAYNNLGVIYRQTDETQKAIESFEQAIKLNPDFAKAYLNLAEIYDSLGAYKQAIDFYEKGIHLTLVPAETLENLVRLYLKTQNGLKAVPILKQIIKLKPEDGKAYLALAFVYAQQKQPLEAQLYYRKAKELGAYIPASLRQVFDSKH